MRSRKPMPRAPAPPGTIVPVQAAIKQADHLLIFYPLWHGHFPAFFHACLEQTFRPGFAVAGRGGGMPLPLLAGKSARVVVTMGMPVFFYRCYYGAHCLKSLTRNILHFSGIKPVKTTLIGGLGAGAALPNFAKDFRGRSSAKRCAYWLDKLHALGRAGR